MATCGALCISWLLTLAVSDICQEARRLPNVSRVTSDTLPNEEVLLRSSDASTQEQSQVLLRGTHNSEETEWQELLRSSRRQDS